MKTPGKFFCNECGEIPAMNKEPSRCPICGAEIQFVTEQQAAGEKKRFSTSDERAAEWFKKMRESIQ